MAEVAERLAQARAAAASGAWPQAYALLSEIDGRQLAEPDELEMLGEVAWWTGRVDECIDARTRAFAARLERGEEPLAAALALKIGRELEHSGLPSPRRGSLVRSDCWPARPRPSSTAISSEPAPGCR